jgi:hypothetical protein
VPITLAVAEHGRNRPDRVSLHWDQRKKYWQEQQDWYLSHINKLRLGHQLPPVTDTEDHEFDYDDPQKDPYLLAGAKVIADWIDMAQ